ncbi:hypothetical protein BT69DRAFT_1345433 [Atractiella rhizophila]|nr:hypothetical protein BT69DRAFT_1345433 [Atractiella rhizophila]
MLMLRMLTTVVQSFFAHLAIDGVGMPIFFEIGGDEKESVHGGKGMEGDIRTESVEANGEPEVVSVALNLKKHNALKVDVAVSGATESKPVVTVKPKPASTMVFVPIKSGPSSESSKRPTITACPHQPLPHAKRDRTIPQFPTRVSTHRSLLSLPNRPPYPPFLKLQTAASRAAMERARSPLIWPRVDEVEMPTAMAVRLKRLALKVKDVGLECSQEKACHQALSEKINEIKGEITTDMMLVRHAIASRTIVEQLRSVFVKDGTFDALKQKAVDLSREMEEVELKIMCLNLAWEKLVDDDGKEEKDSEEG